jgi:hypothetical protein
LFAVPGKAITTLITITNRIEATHYLKGGGIRDQDRGESSTQSGSGAEHPIRAPTLAEHNPLPPDDTGNAFPGC